MSDNIEVIWKGPTALGEGPMWHPQQHVLYWIDIIKPALHCLNPATGDYHHWVMPGYIGSVVPRASGGVVATVGGDVVAVDLNNGNIESLVTVVPNERSDFRTNDGKCDRQGRFWIGVMHAETNNPQGGLFRFDSDGVLTQVLDNITISNGLGWSPDNKTFYFTDSLRYRVNQYNFDASSGNISARRDFVTLDGPPATPDGLTVDSEGFVWQAQWDNWKIVRFAPDGSIDREIKMPVQRPTSCMFGGPDLDILYVTSCSINKGEQQALPAPAGALFAVDVGVRGLPEGSFAG